MDGYAQSGVVAAVTVIMGRETRRARSRRSLPGLLAKRKRALDEEIQAHFHLAIQDRLDRGEALEEARAGAMLELGMSRSLRK